MFRRFVLQNAQQLNRVSTSLIKTPILRSNQISLIRNFSSGIITRHGHIHKPKEGEELHITFITKEGEQLQYEVAEGDTILDIAQHYNLDMEGACGGSCACSTCHVIVDPEYYEKLEEPDDDENDMLDLAFGLTETSRLGCQVKMSKEIDGIRVALPAMTRNVASSDFS
ncbi:hypothetical protein WICPIJ_001997 [Wickerhamomyces pijperi]|uniref:2Fe-2S ferredoxin-type domain-containing protein n=1 Tax=Wickerhamomyces pijperi TaxID=599730 RepID=A0A9P8QCJ9_WICPI|nr:hypothetical protein WICPIJ_001997 [Wickerhamomyces pijperi]